MSELTDPKQGFDDRCIRLRENIAYDEWRSAAVDATERMCLPDVNERALAGLKFSAALPQRLAVATLAARLAGTDVAQE